MPKSWESPKDPQEVRDYGIDWSGDIGAATIQSSAWAVVSGTLTLVGNDFDDTTTTVRVSGGTLGQTCELLNHIVLSNGEEAELTCKLKIRAK
jgi:hypothetical protein